ncbi:dihydrolipoyl dehydrogenase [Prevotella dentasini]|uniref:dihydrolipoyl dehydrogenase n=1 Tax=Prevotella dentasini TaxID=589537 RepID=UPI00046931A0|nr:dihydrolipoyl dehydrogenase [Prevotella dentasini]
MTKTDIIIIGAGPGGYRAAAYAAHEGKKVTIIEKRNAGGTCLNEGCIPTKSFAHDADLYRNPLLSCIGGGQVKFKYIQERKQNVVAQLRQGVESLLAQPGITYIKGEARFVSEKVIEVNGEQMTAENIIIATGSRPKMLPFLPNLQSEEGKPYVGKLMTSTELLDIDYVPSNLVIIGAGVIGMEFASAFETFGANVTVVEFMKECLPTLDSDLAKRLRKTLEKRGINFHLQSGVNKIELAKQDEHEGLMVHFTQKGEEQQVFGDVVLVATGREPVLENLHLEAAGIVSDRKGITVDDNMQTNVPGVYAIGDVNGRQMLAHAATFQGFRAINHILGKTDFIRFDIMPSAIFTYPEAASVGLTEDACKKEGIKFVSKKGFYRSNGKAIAMEETEGMLKLLADTNGKLLGCHVYGAHAADLVQEVAALMNRDTTIDEAKDIIHIHPTLGEIFQDAII